MLDMLRWFAALMLGSKVPWRLMFGELVEGGGGWGGVLNIIRSRSRMTIDPRIATMPGRTRQILRAPSGKCRTLYGES